MDNSDESVELSLNLKTKLKNHAKYKLIKP